MVVEKSHLSLLEILNQVIVLKLRRGEQRTEGVVIETIKGMISNNITLGY
jgi:hypothetical protein